MLRKLNFKFLFKDFQLQSDIVLNLHDIKRSSSLHVHDAFPRQIRGNLTDLLGIRKFV